MCLIVLCFLSLCYMCIYLFDCYSMYMLCANKEFIHLFIQCHNRPRMTFFIPKCYKMHCGVGLHGYILEYCSQTLDIHGHSVLQLILFLFMTF